MSKYFQRPVGKAELRSLVALASEEERAFFERNSRLIPLYRDRLIAIALCQGAALQYLSCGYGVKDFDVHFFYRQNPDKLRLSRAVKRVHAHVGAFKNIPVDFIRTVVPSTELTTEQSIKDRIQSFLRKRPTANSVHLSKKAVVGLLPSELFGKVLWRPTGTNSAEM
jgi:hypothetical protein